LIGHRLTPQFAEGTTDHEEKGFVGECRGFFRLVWTDTDARKSRASS